MSLQGTEAITRNTKTISAKSKAAQKRTFGFSNEVRVGDFNIGGGADRVTDWPAVVSWLLNRLPPSIDRLKSKPKEGT